jgi:hypothetical protein
LDDGHEDSDMAQQLITMITETFFTAETLVRPDAPKFP